MSNDLIAELVEAESRSVASKPLAAKPPISPVSQGILCPKCGAGKDDYDEPCIHCGFIIPSKESAESHGKLNTNCGGIPLLKILKAPFDMEVRAQAMAITAVVLMWQVKMAIIVSGLFILSLGIGRWAVRTHPFGSRIICEDAFRCAVVLCLFAWPILSFLRMIAWEAGKQFKVVKCYRQGRTWSDEPSDTWKDLGLWAAVTVIAFGPLGLGRVDTSLLCIAVPWAVLYGPMAMAIAGSEQSVNPARVIQAIIRCCGGYLLILLYMIPVAAIVGLGAIAAYLLILAAFRDLGLLSPLWLWAIQVTGSILYLGCGQYLRVSTSAMLGMLLRKHEYDRELSGKEVVVGLSWIATASAVSTGVAIFVLAIVRDSGLLLDRVLNGLSH